MNLDFTRKKYRELLLSFQKAGYKFITFAEYCKGIRFERFVVLRHDVDLLPYHSLATAKIEHELGCRAVYYFRAVPESWNESVIKQIAGMNHEIGYHYESLTTCHGEIDAAYNDFRKNLEALRKLSTVETICMHGSPRSPYDSKDIWKQYDYKVLDIIGEPYFDIDFSDVFYLTDTGRCWDGYRVSVRDKIPDYQERWTDKGWTYHGTDDIIRAVANRTFPQKVMVTTHPQRWNIHLVNWCSELILQGMKNIVKRVIVLLRT